MLQCGCVELVGTNDIEFLPPPKQFKTDISDDIVQVFLNAFAKGLAKLLPKTLCDGIMNKDINK